MLGPYVAKKDKTLSYRGNNVFGPMEDIISTQFPTQAMNERVFELKFNPMWGKIANINHRINYSTNEFFDAMNAKFTLLPLTTRMISSPGAVYGKEAINYTTDTCPITMNWFDLEQNAFLSESSQIYLEIALMQQNTDHVYSVYNSFRKENADATHLSEFHHIEYEGKVTQQENVAIIQGLIKKILEDLLNRNEEDLEYIVGPEKVKELSDFKDMIHKVPQITFKQALDALYTETKDDKYKEFTLEHFGSWEEVLITQLYENMVIISQYPLLEVPFYHAVVDGSEPLVADNADIIWPGYRETVGSGHRVRSIAELESKAEIFNLPKGDYAPYLQTRQLEGYVETSGFGIGWERLLQGLLEMPFIWSAAQFPRAHTTLKP